MINASLDPNRFAITFIENRIVEIDNFLEQETADVLNRFYYKTMPHDWWYSATVPSIGGGESPTYHRHLQGNEEYIRTAEECAKLAFSKGDYAYIFDRTIDDHRKGCACGDCSLRKFMASQDVLDFISSATGVRVSKPTEMFASRYRVDNFLALHRDQNRGRVAFTYSIAKDWMPYWGGNLHILEEDNATVLKCLTPKFNCLRLFSLEDKGKPHFVSHVNKQAEYHRITFSGWYE